MRRLPVYFVIDISDSMAGEPVRQVEDGLAMIIRELKRDPYALETVYISIIGFAGKAVTLVPLTDIIAFYPPRLPIGSGTSIGVALDHLGKELKNSIVNTTSERKGDWKPIVFLFTDGAPTDKYEQALDRWKREWQNRVSTVCIAFGDNTDVGLLHKLTENVMLFKNTTPDAYKTFFQWVTASIRASSQSVNTGNGDNLNLAPKETGIVEPIPGGASNTPTGIDNSVATFLGKCQQTKKHYLIKYNRHVYGSYRLEGAFPVGEDYFNLSEEGGGRISASVGTESLQGFPNCPCCGNTIGLCLCQCGGVFCSAETATTATCPWCNQNLRFAMDGEGGNRNFNINRTRG